MQKNLSSRYLNRYQRKFLGYFLPNEFMQDELLLVRAINILPLSGLVTLLGIGSVFIKASSGDSLGMVLSIVLLSSSLSAPFVIKYRKSVKLAGFLTILPIYLTIMYGNIHVGGLQINSVSWFLGLAVIAVLVNGRQIGLYWVGITALSAAGIHLVDTQLFELTNHYSGQFDEQTWQMIELFDTLTIMIFLLLVAFANERSKMVTFEVLSEIRKDLSKRMGELNDAHQELKISEEEVRQNAEELQTLNDYLQKTSVELAESEERFRILVEKMGEGLVTVDKDFYITYMNNRGCELFGLNNPSEAIGQTPLVFLDEENQRLFWKGVEKHQNGDCTSYELQWIGNDGRIFDSIVTPEPLFSEDGNYNGSIVVIADISAFKAAQRALAANEDRLKMALEVSGTFLWESTLTDGILEPPKRLFQFLGYDNQDKLDGKCDIADIIHSDDMEKVSQAIRAHIAQKTSMYQVDFRVKNKQGAWLWLTTAGKFIPDGSNSDGKILGLYWDITWRKEVEQELNQKNKALSHANEELTATLEKLKQTQVHLVDAEKMASLGQLTAGIAHEINNPINFVAANVSPLRQDLKDITTLLELVREQANSQQALFPVMEKWEELDMDYLLNEVGQLLGGIEEGANRTKEIVSGLRSFSRMDENEFKYVDIHENIVSTLTLLQNKTKNRIEIHKDFGDVPPFECLPGKINQIFMNLFSNAIQAIEDKGDIYIRTWADSECIHVTIRDTGKGIPLKNQRKIFEPFFTTKDIGKGTGLGLSITYGIVNQHDGKIDVKSDPGKGAEFHVQFPIEHVDQKPEASSEGLAKGN